MGDPTGPRAELRERIMAKLVPVLLAGPATADPYADAVMELFYEVEDHWDRIDVTTMATDGESFIENRWLVARAPVQGQSHERIADRRIRG